MKLPTIKYKGIFKWNNSCCNITIFFMVVFLLTAQTSLLAQENQKKSNIEKAELRNGVKYYIAVYFDYKQGKTGEAFKLIERHFIPVDKEADRFVIQFRPLTGSWDEIAFFPLEIGPEALAYSLSPSDAMWNATFVKQAGSQKEVNEIWVEFQSLVKSMKTEREP